MKLSSAKKKELKQKLVTLKQEHRELDLSIAQLIESFSASQLEIQRLKKQKLKFKDQILRIESLLIPDLHA